MATVYLAQDLKHQRQVAIKVLRPELAAMLGADRFLQEITTTAQLQHPHILPLFDSGQADGCLYYVMPYVEGETLRTTLHRLHQLGVDEAVRITTQVADALDYAHRHGVIHRDIKPENILLHDGRPMVADFGIALAVSTAAGGRMTQTGLSLGTPHYMSPEQAAADKRITHRSDVYSLGAVLYEMLTGEPPHTGPSAQAVLKRIVTDRARPVLELRDSVPPNVAAATAKALEKLPADRFETARAFAEALTNPAFTVRGTGAATGAQRSDGPAVRWAALSAITILAALVLAAWGWLRRLPNGPVMRYVTALVPGDARDGISFRIEVAISPDGGSIVFRNPPAGPGQLYIKRREEVTARPLPGTEDATAPFFSADGAWIGFFAGGQMRKIASTGGTPLTLADSIAPLFAGGAWLEDGSIVYYDGTHVEGTYGKLRRWRAGSVPQVIASTATVGGRAMWLPTPLPSARGALFTAHLTTCEGPSSCRPSRVYVYDARRDTIRLLFEDAIGAWYVPTGHVLYVTSAGTLMAIPWDNEALAATGPPTPILDGLQAPGLVVSAEGTALYVLGRPLFNPGPTPNAEAVWVDREGRVASTDSSWRFNTGTDWSLALSPDGRRIAIKLLTNSGSDIWIKQLPAGPLSRLTLYPGEDRAPAWTADGQGITFLSDRPTPPDPTRRAHGFSLWRQAATGTGDPRLLWANDSPTEAFASPDGRWVVLRTTGPDRATEAGDILAARPGADTVARRLVATEYDETGPALSPDSRWLAYVSNETGEDEVFIRPFPDVNRGKWQVSSGGASAPVWGHDSRELFYVGGGTMQVVQIRPGPSFAAGPPRPLFVVPDRVRAGSPAGGKFAIAPDDQRFLMVRDEPWTGTTGTPTLIVVENFFRELREKVKR
jgi:serine/threonine-protein kinase